MRTIHSSLAIEGRMVAGKQTEIKEVKNAYETYDKIMTFDIIKAQEKHQDKHQVRLSDTQIKVLKALEDINLSRKEIFAAIGMNADSRALKRHIEPLLSGGFIEMTVPDKPNIRLQKYRLTEKDKVFISRTIASETF